MVLAGILLSTSFGLLLIILLGLPFTWILKLLLPFTLMLSSPSTVTNGTLRSISITVLVFESGSSSMLYSILSTSTFTSGFWATTSIPFSSLVASAIFNFPRSITFSLALTVKSFTIVTLPTDDKVIIYSPGATVSFSWNLPFKSVTAILRAFWGAFFFAILIVA